MITILNYGLGNLLSIKNMLKKVGQESIVTSDIDQIKNASKIILPGVGHFDYGMKKLRASEFYSLLNQKVLEEEVPILGICLGAQMLLEGSDEGDEPGLGWIKGTCKKFDFSSTQQSLPVPNMGWQDVEYIRATALNTSIDTDPRYYFAHSYFIECKNTGDILATANYGFEYTVGIQAGNIFGVQFHPEKSHRFGMQLLKNFSAI